MRHVAGIILAAGASSRMGEDKALLNWHGRTFLEHLSAALRSAGAQPLRVVLGANAEEVQRRVKFGAEEVVVNREWQRGMLSSLVSGINSLPHQDVTAAVVCLVDHPCVSSRLIRALIEKHRETGKLIIQPIYQGRRGHPVLFAASLFNELRVAPPEVGARHVVYQHAGDILEVATDEEGIVLNINDKAAYEKVLGMAAPG